RRYHRDSCHLPTSPQAPTPYACPTSVSHSSPEAERAHHCPTDTSAHPSPVPLSPIPLRSAAASRPSGNRCSHSTNLPSRPDASDGAADSCASFLRRFMGRGFQKLRVLLYGDLVPVHVIGIEGDLM